MLASRDLPTSSVSGVSTAMVATLLLGLPGLPVVVVDNRRLDRHGSHVIDGVRCEEALLLRAHEDRQSKQGGQRTTVPLVEFTEPLSRWGQPHHSQGCFAPGDGAGQQAETHQSSAGHHRATLAESTGNDGACAEGATRNRPRRPRIRHPCRVADHGVRQLSCAGRGPRGTRCQIACSAPAADNPAQHTSLVSRVAVLMTRPSPAPSFVARQQPALSRGEDRWRGRSAHRTDGRRAASGRR